MPEQKWIFIGIDLASGPDMAMTAETYVNADGIRRWRDANPETDPPKTERPKVERMNPPLYGTKVWVHGTIDLKKGKDGVWR